MARPKLDMPSGSPLISVNIPVRITDVNYGNHVGNDAIVSILHEARMQFLAEKDFTELNAGGTSLIMSHLEVNFINEAFYGDVLKISIFADGLTAASFDFYYLLETLRDDLEMIIAKAKTGMVCYDYDAGKVSRITERLKELLVGKKLLNSAQTSGRPPE